MRIIVTGGAGFVGSHLIDRLLEQGHEVVCVDSFYSGKKENIAHHLKNPKFTLRKHDVRTPLKISGAVDAIYHLACPASPVQYQFDPVLTLETSVLGARNMLQLARAKGAKMLYTSTSEIYGDPLEHPQKESYWGNVDTLGKRACYDEGKRAAETLCKDFHEQYHVDVRIVRLFNVYGPRMMLNDGRVLSNFILQALTGEDITVFGDGTQTRSFMYVSDLVDALVKRMEQQDANWRPMNLGNPDERSMMEAAEAVKEMTNSQSTIVKIPYEKIPSRLGDPKQRCADISFAKKELDWQPTIPFAQGLEQTIQNFKERLMHRPRIAVFIPSYLPMEGPVERMVAGIIDRAPTWGFDIITAKQQKGLSSLEKQNDQVTVHRLGSGTSMDKWLFPLRAARYAKKLHKKESYAVAWAVMASYGAVAAALFSRLTKVPFLLSVYEGDITDKMLQKGTWLSPVYQFIFRDAHRWQIIGNMNQQQQAWLEDERHVQALHTEDDIEKIAKKTKEMFAEVEILSTRLS